MRVNDGYPPLPRLHGRCHPLLPNGEVWPCVELLRCEHLLACKDISPQAFHAELNRRFRKCGELYLSTAELQTRLAFLLKLIGIRNARAHPTLRQLRPRSVHVQLVARLRFADNDWVAHCSAQRKTRGTALVGFIHLALATFP